MKRTSRTFVIFVGMLLSVQFCKAWNHIDSCGDGSDETARTRVPTPSPSGSISPVPEDPVSGSRSKSSGSSFSSSSGGHSRTCDCSTPSTLLSELSTSESEDSSSIAFDGMISDIARRLYMRYEAGDEVHQMALNAVPDVVQRRLGNFSLEFDDLPGLIQRAVLWDSGFLVTADDLAVQVWTFDNRSMAEISVSVAQFNGTGCQALPCSQANGDLFQTYSSCSSGPTQILAASKCIMEVFESNSSSNETLWSTGGGDSSTVPEIRAVKNVGTTECGCEYTVYSISTNAAASTSSQCESSGSPVIPCYGNDSVPEAIKARMTTPKGEEWVTGWILDYGHSKTPKESSGSSNQSSSSTTTETGEGGSGGFNWWWLLLILLILLLLIIATIVACRHCHRLSRFNSPPNNTTYIFVGGRMWAVEDESHSRGATYWLRFANWCRKTFNFFD